MLQFEMRYPVDVLLAFKAFGQRPPDATAFTQEKAFTPMALHTSGKGH